MKYSMYKTMLLLTLTILLSHSASSQNKSDTQRTELSLSESVTKYGQVLYYINNYYLDTVKFGGILDKAILETINQLDPHSSYISADEVKAANEPLEAEFEGIGIEFAIIKDTLTVQATVAGGPSERVGLRIGDKIIGVDNDIITGVGITNDRVYKYLRGEKGTKVNLKVIRRGSKEPLIFVVERDKIPIYSIDASYEVEPGIVYIKLSKFAITSGDEVIKAIKSVKGGPKGVILDLRGNSGGLLYTALVIANQFLNRGEMILYTEGRTVNTMREFAHGDGVYKNGPLVVLVDENSASASEIVAGAIQDWDRGLVIGRRSFGKGLVQQMLPLNDGAQLRLTIARYHTPSGRVIQTPYEEGNKTKYYTDFYKRWMNGENVSKDSISLPDSLKYRTLKEGRTVYGGGGIMPDIFVPQDTTYYTNYYGELIRKSIVIDYTNDLGDQYRNDWQRLYPDIDTFNAEFDKSEEFFEGLLQYAEEKGVERDEEQIAISRNNLKIYMKALAARRVFETEDFYRIMTQTDPIYQKALEEIRRMVKVFTI